MVLLSLLSRAEGNNENGDVLGAATAATAVALLVVPVVLVVVVGVVDDVDGGANDDDRLPLLAADVAVTEVTVVTVSTSIFTRTSAE